MKQLAVIFPQVDPEVLDTVLKMVGGQVETAAQFIFDLMQQNTVSTGDDNADDETGEKPPYLIMRNAQLPPEIQRVVRQSSWFAQLPFISNTDDLEVLLPELQRSYRGEFHCALSFDPEFVAKLIRHGYLTMAEHVGRDQYVLLPKMHTSRCLLQWKDVKVERNVQKRCKQYSISMDTCFEQVLQGCVKQHGEAWLYKPLREVFTYLHHHGPLLGVGLHSFELWDGDVLVAGELGTAVGGCYTALSGFMTKAYPSSGTVQLCASAKILECAGFAFWDLGMEIPYKLQLGAKSVEKEHFLQELHAVVPREYSTENPEGIDLSPYKVKTPAAVYLRPDSSPADPPGELMQECESASLTDMDQSVAKSTVEPLSKNQQKKIAKAQKRKERKLAKQPSSEPQC